MERDQEGAAIFQMEVVLNPELERDLLAFGEGVQVLAPKELVNRMSKRLRMAAERYV